MRLKLWHLIPFALIAWMTAAITIAAQDKVNAADLFSALYPDSPHDVVITPLPRLHLYAHDAPEGLDGDQQNAFMA